MVCTLYRKPAFLLSSFSRYTAYYSPVTSFPVPNLGKAAILGPDTSGPYTTKYVFCLSSRKYVICLLLQYSVAVLYFLFISNEKFINYLTWTHKIACMALQL